MQAESYAACCFHCKRLGTLEARCGAVTESQRQSTTASHYCLGCSSRHSRPRRPLQALVYVYALRAPGLSLRCPGARRGDSIERQGIRSSGRTRRHCGLREPRAYDNKSPDHSVRFAYLIGPPASRSCCLPPSLPTRLPSSLPSPYLLFSPPALPLQVLVSITFPPHTHPPPFVSLV